MATLHLKLPPGLASVSPSTLFQTISSLFRRSSIASKLEDQKNRKTKQSYRTNTVVGCPLYVVCKNSR
jgi:hypothetical protein